MVGRRFAARRARMALVTLTVTAVVVAQATAVAAAPVRRAAPAPSASKGPAVQHVEAVEPHFPARIADPAHNAFRATATRWPAAGSESLTAVPSGRAGAEGARSGGSSLVWVAAAAGSRAAATVHVAVADQKVSQALSVPGVVFTVTAPADVRADLRVGVDYSQFAQAYGGDFGSRLQLVRLPDCALSTPAAAGCRALTRLASRNIPRESSVSAPVNLAPGGTVVLAATSSTDPGAEGGDGGTFAATSLKPSGTWAAGNSSGSFTYSYPLVLPPAASDLVPKLGLDYDSSSVDGQSSSTQAQSSWVGDGWSSGESFIEQTFTSCGDDPEGAAAPEKTSDLCYAGPILTLSLNGSSTPLVYDSGTWRPATDDGSVVKHVTNSGNGSGTYNTDYWTVTTRDGTVYSFGRNRLPGWASGKAATNSVDSVPVYSAHAPNGTSYTDPCYKSTGFTDSWCTMAYRWRLDYVTDTHANAIAYYYGQDTNFYGRHNGATATEYVRDSHLDHIDYGFTDTQAYGTVADRVVFHTGDRCVSGTCQPLNSTTKANWPDVPFDMICASGATCHTWGPSFFSTVRLASIDTTQYTPASPGYTTVDTYTLTQTIPATGDGTSTDTAPTLWLASLGHTGKDLTAGDSQTRSMPALSFASIQLQNRLDTVTDGLPPMYRHRISSITTESGSVITVTYDRPNPCDPSAKPSASANTSSCYPVSWTPSGYANPITDWFNKYAVTKVSASDPTGGALAVTTTYTYLGGAAWHYDDNEVVKAKYRTYGQFRGYGRVQTRQGDATSDRQTLNESRFYRGMSKNNSTTVVNVTDTAGGVHEDVNELAGQTLETMAYRGDTSTLDNSTITSYWVSAARGTRTRSGLADLTAKATGPVMAYSRQALTASGTTTWRLTETDTSYDTNTTSGTFGLEKATYSHTVPVNTAYDRCTTTAYAPVNTTNNLAGLVAEVETDSVACSGYTAGTAASVPGGINTLAPPANVDRPAQVVSATRTFYDDPGFSTTFPQNSVSRGDVTMVRKASDYTGGAFVYTTQSESTYDSFGRISDAYDGNGGRTHTDYTANSVGVPTGTTVHNALDQTTTTTLDPLRGVTLTASDINGVVATEHYDALGRVTDIWQNSRATSLPANLKFTYQLSNTGVTAITTQELNNSSGYTTSTVIYDALLRPRQTQKMTPQGGRMVTDTFYDSRGWTSKTNNGWWDPATTPNTTLVAPSAADQKTGLPDQDAYTYDGLGRAVVDTSMQNNVTVSTTTTVYNGDRTTVIPPTGGTVKTTITDPMGRTSQIDSYSSRPTLNTPSDTFTGIYTITGGTSTSVTYGFDSHGNQSTTTEAGPHTWTMTYNLLGQVTDKTDPDAGTISNQRYDGNSNLTQYTDANNKTISFTYDLLDRKTGQYASTIETQAPTNQLAKWVYDNSDGAATGMHFPNGHLTSKSAYIGGTSGSEYKTQITDFDVFGNSLGEDITIPSTEGALGVKYSFTHTYTTITGQPNEDIYPGLGNLPAETVTHGYGVLDLPTTLTGRIGYGKDTTYDAFGRVNQETIGAGSYLGYITNTWDTHTGWLKDQLLTRSTTTPTNVDEQAYTYDLSGNITQQTETRLGSTTTTETQCYRYNGLTQLTAAWTATDNCAVTPTTASHTMLGSGLGSSSVYWTTWTVDANGWTGRTKHYTGATGTDTTTSYTYDGNSADQPHTLTGTNSVTGTSTVTTAYTYDPAGNMATRDAGNGHQVFTYNTAGKLTQISGSTNGSSSFVYDADGNLLLQKDPGSTVLYLPNQQLTLNTSTGTVTGVRYYDLPGGGQAYRTGTLLTAYGFVLADQHGTPTLYLDRTAQNPTWRQYTPYGDPRGAAVTAPDNRGFLDQPTNTASGLTHLGAREYDPGIGRFTSVDPLFDSTDPTQLGGYSYAGTDPINRADPEGTWGFHINLSKALKVVATVASVASIIPGPVGMIAAGVATVAYAANGDWKDAAMMAGGIALAAAGAGAAAVIATRAARVADAGVAAAKAARTADEAAKVANEAKNAEHGIQEADEAANAAREAKTAQKAEGEASDENCLTGFNSFDPNTPVLLANGSTEPIKDITVGDIVVATDPTTGTTDAEPVTQLHDNLDTELTDLTLTLTGSPAKSDTTASTPKAPTTASAAKPDTITKPGTPTAGASNRRDTEDTSPAGTATVVHTTAHHPFWDATTQRWTDAAKLQPGDQLHTSAIGITVTVAAVHTWTGQHRMLNLTVGTTHTYYVLAGTTPILVHNCGRHGSSETADTPDGYSPRHRAPGVDPSDQVAWHAANAAERSRPLTHRIADAVKQGYDEQEKLNSSAGMILSHLPHSLHIGIRVVYGVVRAAGRWFAE